jgi:hypothetical protein
MDGLLAIRWIASESRLIQRLLAFDYVPIACMTGNCFSDIPIVHEGAELHNPLKASNGFCGERNPICIVENGLPVFQCSLPSVLPGAGVINMDT